MSNVLIRNGRHQRPLLAVLKRYSIGSADQYGRGLWISAVDLPAIKEGMLSDKSCIIGDAEGTPIVNGSSIHNSVWYTDFVELLQKTEG